MFSFFTLHVVVLQHMMSYMFLMLYIYIFFFLLSMVFENVYILIDIYCCCKYIYICLYLKHIDRCVLGDSIVVFG